MKNKRQVILLIYRYVFLVMGVVLLLVGILSRSGFVKTPALLAGVIFLVISAFVWFDHLVHGETKNQLKHPRYGHISVHDSGTIYTAGVPMSIPSGVTRI